MKYKKSVYESLAMVTQFGINMMVPIVLCTLFGVFLGERFSIPVVTVPLFFLGAFAGFRNVYRLSKKIFEQKDPDYHTSIKEDKDVKEIKRTEKDQ